MRDLLLTVVVALAAATARADPPPAGSVVGARTVARERNALEFGIGHADVLAVAWRHGVTDRFEMGLGAAATLGYRGLLFVGGGTYSGSSLGTRVEGRFLWTLLEAEVVSLGVSVRPGASFSTWNTIDGGFSVRVDTYGIELPIDARLGVTLSPRTTLGLMLKMPLFLEFWSISGSSATLRQDAGWPLVPRVSIGLEHALSERVLLFGQVGSRLSALWTVDLQLGLLWTLPS